MGSIRGGLLIWVLTVCLSWFSLLNSTIVQLFILLAILIYIPQLYSTFFNKDIWNLTVIGGIGVVLSFQFNQGMLSSLFTIPWLVITVIILEQNRPEFSIAPSELLVMSSTLFLLGASSALMLSRLGLQPLNFSHTIIELTAIHFHYSGIMIPVFIEQIYQRLPTRTMTILAYMIALGTPTVALGITLGKFLPPVGIIAVLLFAGPLMIISTLLILNNFSMVLKFAHLLLFLTMVLAIFYALGVSFQIRTIDIPTMIITHGILNGLVFVPLSLYGWDQSEHSDD